MVPLSCQMALRVPCTPYQDALRIFNVNGSGRLAGALKLAVVMY